MLKPFLLLVALMMIDAWGTQLTIQLTNVGIEQNPMIRYAIQHYGMWSMYAIKLILAAVGYIFIRYRIPGPAGINIIFLGIGFYMCICLVHFFNLKGLLNV